MTDENKHSQKKLIADTDKEISAVTRNPDKPTSIISLFYDFAILGLISLDLLFILIDKVLMSDALKNFGTLLANQVSFSLLSDLVNNYANSGFEWINHAYLSIAGGFFTLFLIYEIIIRWALAIINKTYYRWFFFPFIHWYEIIGCFPQLRVFRLLRAVAIGRRLHKMGHKVMPKKWLATIQFYYGMILEELSDRVLLTAVANVRTQLNNSIDSQVLVKKTIDNNRANIESMILSMLRTELAPRLRQELMPTEHDSPVAKHVGCAVSEAVVNTPELRSVLRKIPIAGSMIESQIMGISEKVGYNIADSVNRHLLKDEVLDEVFISIAHGVSQINTSNPALESLVSDIIEESLTAFENQVKIQQWQHHEEMEKMTL